MKTERLIQNIIGQIKEAQLKLGFAKESIRLYYVLDSLNAILGTDSNDINELYDRLTKELELQQSVLGNIIFKIRSGRLEVSVPVEGVEYVHNKIPDPAFLKDIIELFQVNHHCTLDQICDVFEKYSSDYTCKKMNEDTDFDYAIYFNDKSIDDYYYCIKMEMGHTIYHRFTEEDYIILTQ